MAEVFDFGLQRHKIKMDGKFFESNLFAVAGDTGRRLEVQLLDSNNMVQNTIGISLRLNANVAGQATYAEATLVDPTKGLYELDLPNGMLIAPGNWQFQWQIIGTSGEKLHSFAFMGSIGSNLSEGGTEAVNFYLNVEELKEMQEDLINGTFNSEVLETNIAEKLNNLEEQYAPRLTEVTAQLEQIAHTPRLSISQVANRNSDKSVHGVNSDFVIFKDIYIAYDNTNHASGAVYGLEEHRQNTTAQAVYKSLDGGETWEKVGDLVIESASGIWFTQIYFEPIQETFYLVKTYGGHAENANEVVSFTKDLVQIGRLDINSNRWLSNNQSIDTRRSKNYAQNVTIFGEYGTSLEEWYFSIWRTVDRGATWTNVKRFSGDINGIGTGEIRHIHCVQVDPYTGDWWMGAGDADSQCQIWRSQDDGITWGKLFEGSQRERTTNFLFEKDYIFYGMDSTNNTHPENIKIIRINKSTLNRDDVATVDNGYAVYSLTKTMHPEGFLVWTCYEGEGVSIESDRVAVEFYDYLTEKLYPVAYINTKGVAPGYKGFQSASKHQEYLSGNIFALPTPNLQQGKYGYDKVSRHIKVKIVT